MELALSLFTYPLIVHLLSPRGSLSGHHYNSSSDETRYKSRAYAHPLNAKASNFTLLPKGHITLAALKQSSDVQHQQNAEASSKLQSFEY